MNIVREHINERFEQQSDPIEDMDIGINSIKKDIAKYNVFKKCTTGSYRNKIIETLEKFFNKDAKDLYLLGTNRLNNDYIMKLYQYIIKDGKKVFYEQFTTTYSDNIDAEIEPVMFYGYETSIGKIAALRYPNEPTLFIQYIGDIETAFILDIKNSGMRG